MLKNTPSVIFETRCYYNMNSEDDQLLLSFQKILYSHITQKGLKVPRIVEDN